ncbi:putative siderophore transport system ATP-binding protein YusV [Ferriphaselus amnicola]|uniref:Putative siderophore transport system ATP-binding protein YusV n=2 Tax=Ferriphaselus amnicola TaxID=1188319 RepID=A0A2Z6GDX9_9PROT|nr:putative siderophore transport system ATP-binding protein YusV [Ferriphaselus amnicola]
MLEARSLTVSMGGKTVCRELSFAVQSGECWGVLGQNGAGKSTLLRTLAGLHQPDSGEVRWGKSLLTNIPRRELAQQLGVLLQSEGGEFWGSVLDYVLLGRFPHRRALFGYRTDDEAIARQAMAAMDLSELAQRPLNQLSGGERQRAAIAQLLAQQAQCLLLDEPLQHLDLRHQAQVMELLSGMKSRAVFMVLHDLLWAQRCCDHLLLMFPDGQVLAGASAELLTCEHLEALYQCRLRVAEVEGERCFLPGV